MKGCLFKYPSTKLGNVILYFYVFCGFHPQSRMLLAVCDITSYCTTVTLQVEDLVKGKVNPSL
jgi:hypothetical protein